MWYDVAITVAANTAESAASKTKVPITHGVITRMSFRPRPGHSGLCHVQVFYHDLQLAPVSRDEDLHGDAFPIEWNDYIEIFTDPYELLVKAWNEDVTYDHTFDLGFALIPEEIAKPESGLVANIKKLLGLVGIK